MSKALALLALIVLCVPQFAQSGNGAPQRFAQCLADRGAKMYSAWWCPHCLAQLREFDVSWSKADMKNSEKLGVEFPFVTECADKITGKLTTLCPRDLVEVPTWEFTSGERVSGMRDLEFLSEKTGCLLPTSSK